MLTYEQGAKLLARGRGGSKKLRNNTYLLRVEEHTLAVKLYAVCVVYIRDDGTYVLNSGGWQTHTTKQCINEYTHAWIYQKKYVWYLGDGTPFYNGIRIREDGKPTPAARLLPMMRDYFCFGKGRPYEYVPPAHGGLLVPALEGLENNRTDALSVFLDWLEELGDEREQKSGALLRSVLNKAEADQL